MLDNHTENTHINTYKQEIHTTNFRDYQIMSTELTTTNWWKTKKEMDDENN